MTVYQDAELEIREWKRRFDQLELSHGRANDRWFEAERERDAAIASRNAWMKLALELGREGGPDASEVEPHSGVDR